MHYLRPGVDRPSEPRELGTRSGRYGTGEPDFPDWGVVGKREADGTLVTGYFLGPLHGVESAEDHDRAVSELSIRQAQIRDDARQWPPGMKPNQQRGTAKKYLYFDL